MPKSIARKDKDPTLLLTDLMKELSTRSSVKADSGVTVNELAERLLGAVTPNHRVRILSILKPLCSQGKVLVGRGDRTNIAGYRIRVPVYRLR